MRVRYTDGGQWEQDAVSFALGTIGGLAAGVLISRAMERERLGEGLRERASAAARRLRPARRQRLSYEQAELDRLEEAVLRAFRDDEVLSERPVDIGAISRGIIEISGAVFAEREAERAVEVASRIEGVTTVVNRLDVDQSLGGGRDDSYLNRRTDRGSTHTGSPGGMGGRRQGRETDPDRPDDSQPRREEAMAAADREQFVEEGLAPTHSRMNARPEVQEGNRTRFDEDELDNQDPHGKHARRTLDEQPQELNTDARVGEGIKPGIRRELERSDIEVDEPPQRDR